MEGYTKRKLRRTPPAGAVILVRGRDNNPFMKFVRFGIRFFSDRENMDSAIDHAVMHWGKMGEAPVKFYDEIVEANITGVERQSLRRYINDRDGLLIFYNKNIEKPTKWALVKAACYGRVGRPYDLVEGIFSFVKKYFGIKGKNDPGKNFCSEVVVESFECGNIKTSNLPAGETSPTDLKKFFLSEKGKKAGWKLIDYQNVGTEFFDKYRLKPIA